MSSLTPTQERLDLYYDRWGNAYPQCEDTPVFARRGVFAVLKSGPKILLVHPPRSEPTCDFPGGGVDAGEDLQTALQREVFEETGFRIESVATAPNFEQVTGFRSDDHTQNWVYTQYFWLVDVSAMPDMMFSGIREVVEPETREIQKTEWVDIADVHTRPLRRDHCLALEALVSV
ncbi:MAG: NUDIX domain-containing protein [Alphaproteobacteria bacterium]|nr:NUDIX domain-containing protein [Alphaproteobacteria bacterium]